MNRQYPIALVDTNVWLDNWLPDRPGSNHARLFLNEARTQEIQLTYPVHSLPDFFYLLQAHLKREVRKSGKLTETDALAIREIAWACVDNLRETATAIAADESDAWRACKYRALTGDLEDNFVLAAAERVPVDFIVTNDHELIRKSTINAYTPADATLMLRATLLE